MRSWIKDKSNERSKSPTPAVDGCSPSARAFRRLWQLARLETFANAPPNPEPCFSRTGWRRQGRICGSSRRRASSSFRSRRRGKSKISSGSSTLRAALQRELTRSNVTLAEAPSADNYIVEGKVAMGPGKDGKQPITIDWSVTDPSGKKLGTVSQKNEVPQGSLDGSWGKTADAAAAAAAQGIVKLLPQPTQTTSSN